MRRLGTSTKFRLFTLSINYSTKPGHRCLVVYLGTCLVAISLIVCYYKMVPFLIYVFYAQNGRSRSRDLIYIFFYRESHKLLRVIILLKFVAIGLNPQNLDHPSTFLGKLKKHPCLKVARYSFSRPIPPKLEHKLRRHKQSFGKIATTVVLDKDENLS